MKTLTCWWHLRKSQRFLKVSRIHPLCTMNGCTEYPWNPSHGCWDISVCTEAASRAKNLLCLLSARVNMCLCVMNYLRLAARLCVCGGGYCVIDRFKGLKKQPQLVWLQVAGKIQPAASATSTQTLCCTLKPGLALISLYVTFKC